MQQETRDPVTVLFACVANAGRSQMAAAFFNAAADPRRARAISAGTQPADRVHPEVVEAMREQGIELGGVRPQPLRDALTHRIDVLVTMGCGEVCPVLPGVTCIEWELSDPKHQTLDIVRQIRDDISQRVTQLIQQNDWGL